MPVVLFDICALERYNVLDMADRNDYFEIQLPKLNKGNYLTYILITALLIMSFILGSLYTKVQYLEKEKAQAATKQDQLGQQAVAPTPVPVSIKQIQKLFEDKTNLIFGDTASNQFIVEIADPSCPYCSLAAGQNPQLNRQFGNNFILDTDGGSYIAPVPKIKELLDEKKAAFVWIYSPGHGNGELATKALYCANEQGRFWETHNKMMTNEGYNLLNNEVKNDPAQVNKLADFLASEIDPTQLINCINSGKYDSKIASDSATAASLGVSGTPGFFINTKLFPGAYSWKDMEPYLK